MPQTAAKENLVQPILIVVYGRRENAMEITKCLSRAHVCLPDPIMVDRHVEYDNPYIVKTRKPNLYEKGFIPAPTIRKPLTPEPLAEHVCQTLEHNKFLKGIEPDPWIKAELLIHQKEALSFILQREEEKFTASFSLWELLDRSGRRKYWYLILRKEQDYPEYFQGGILADEMGLGNTLSMISAIVYTLNDVRQWNFREMQKQSGYRQTHATLVFTPSSVLLNGWATEIKRHVHDGHLKVHMYHGQRKHIDAQKLLAFDIVFTTFATLSREFSTQSSPLHSISWFSFFLDEAHFIRNEATKQFKAVSSLTAQRRWCFSGTPVQNSLDDLGVLINFLRVREPSLKPKFQKFIVSSKLHQIAPEIFASTKLQALVKNLDEGRSKGKGIVFSCWKTTLDLVEPLLESSGFKYVRVDGGISGIKRCNIISQFDTDTSITIMLMTTRTGAVGLNLTVATQVHILEPQCNPSIETQAIGRVVRLTNRSPVTVTRYITNNTLEQIKDQLDIQVDSLASELRSPYLESKSFLLAPSSDSAGLARPIISAISN